MSTNCIIATKISENNFVGSYCHYDGYVEHTGKYLHQFYNSPEKAIKLSSLGYISSVEKTFEELLTNTLHKGSTPSFFYSPEEIMNQGEYGYYYDLEERKWYVCTGNEWNELKTVLGVDYALRELFSPM